MTPGSSSSAPPPTRGWLCHVLPPMDVSTLSVILEESASWVAQNTSEEGGEEEVNLGLLDLDLRDCAICTSGDYFSKNAATGYTHITNPKTKQPLLSHDLSPGPGSEENGRLLNQPLSATVLSPSCSAADACATILMLLPPDEVADWVKRYNDVAPLAEQIRRYILVYPLGSPFGERLDVVTTQGKWRRVVGGAGTTDSARPGVSAVVPGRSFSFQVLDSGEGTLDAVHWTESVWERLTESSSGEGEAKPTGLQRLKRILANYPRLVTVVLVRLPVHALPVGFIPTQFRGKKKSAKDLEGTPDETSGLWFAMTLTSGVLLSDKPNTNAPSTPQIEAIFFLMRNGYLAQILQSCSRTSATTESKDGLLCHYAVLNNSEESTKLSEQFSRGTFLEGGTSGGLKDVLKTLCTVSHTLHRRASLSNRIEVVGDHLAVTVSTSSLSSPSSTSATTATGKGTSAAPPPLLRQGREYHSRAKVKYLSVPCVATCSRFPYSTTAAGAGSNPAGQRPSKPVFLATILQAPDYTSRTPPLLTAFAKRNKLNTLLFGEHLTEAASATESRLHVRLHFVDATSTGAGFLDWFADGSCTETDTQFMYFPPPRRLPASVAPSPPAIQPPPSTAAASSQPPFRTIYFRDGTSTCVVDYIFASSYPTRYLDCVYAGQFPVNKVYVGIILKPLDLMTAEEAAGSRRFDGDGESSTGASFPL
jgi:hypothetical protein